MRWIERPTLLSWIIAAISAPFGGVSQITARLPMALFLLFGCVLIYLLLRRVAASVPAALFGAALFLACPLAIRSYVLITADLPLAVPLFFAFYLWWGGNQAGSIIAIGFGRWLAIGVVLAVCRLAQKDPSRSPISPSASASTCSESRIVAANSRACPGRPDLRAAARRLVCGDLYTRRRRATGPHFMRVRPIALLPGPLVASFKTD